MKLSDILKLVLYKNVLNTCYVNKDTKQFNVDKLPAIITFLNEGLLKLYSKFTLKTDSIFLEPQESRTKYPITKEHIIPDWGQSDYDHYLWKGYKEDFPNNLIKILDVYSEQGVKMPVNDTESYWSMYTPMYNVLEIPKRITDIQISIIYQASPDKIVYSTDNDPEIEIPDLLVEPLVAYTNYLIFASIGSQGAMQQAQLFMRQYQTAIDELVESDAINPVYSTQSNKFYKRGWI